jgi:hypothetical protein
MSGGPGGRRGLCGYAPAEPGPPQKTNFAVNWITRG